MGNSTNYAYVALRLLCLNFICTELLKMPFLKLSKLSQEILKFISAKDTWESGMKEARRRASWSSPIEARLSACFWSERGCKIWMPPSEPEATIISLFDVMDFAASVRLLIDSTYNVTRILANFVEDCSSLMASHARSKPKKCFTCDWTSFCRSWFSKVWCRNSVKN